MSEIQININNRPFMVATDSMVEQALTLFNAKPPYAILLNENFLPKSLHVTTPLKAGDKLEVISAIQGG